MALAAPLSSAEVMERFARYVIPNYTRYPVCLVRGEGSHVWDAEGRRYLDFFPGWGCNLLGHCPEPIVQAIQDQVARLIHVPNTWYIEAQGLWAEALSRRSFGGQAFFCNSGAEANEAAIKLARLCKPGRFKILTFDNGFHGRTYGALSATAQPKYHAGLEPMLPGFVYAPFGDLDAARRLVDSETAAVLIEPIQGEGGVNLPPPGFLAGLRDLARERDLLLMFDEVQCGFGRTGRWFAYQHEGVTPDVMTLAKGVCGGVAGAAVLAAPDVAAHLRPGTHAATFGGNPLAARAGLAAIEMIERDDLLAHATRLEGLFRRRFDALRERTRVVAEVRVRGVMIGIELTVPGGPVVEQCFQRGLLVNCTHGNVVRLLPAMNLSEAQLHEGCDILSDVVAGLSG